MDFRVVSIGALARHPLWGESNEVRTGHATTTLVRSGKHTILVDPGLPGPPLVARLKERANLEPEEITHVFLTSFTPETRRAIEEFPEAAWLIAEGEREAIGTRLIEALKRAHAAGDEDVVTAFQQDIAILKRCQAAPDRIADHVDLFPLPGVSPGLSGLLLGGPRHTTLICGDAIPTIEHLETGKVLDDTFDVAQALESFKEAIEIADMLILGRDNLAVNPTKRPF